MFDPPRRLACVWWVLVGWLAGCSQSHPPPPLEPLSQRPHDDIVRIAGAGPGTPVLEHLAIRFQAQSPGHPVSVEAPLGSLGALQALAAGVIDAAIVVQPASAPRPPGGVEVATSPVGVVASSGVPVRSLSVDALAATLLDQAGPWPNGQRRTVLLRAEEDPVQSTLARSNVTLQAAVTRALQRRAWPVFHEDATLRDALKRSEGAIAISDLGSLRQLGVPVWIIRPEGAPVSDEGAAWGELIIWLIPRKGAPPRLYTFLDYIKGEEARRMVVDLGYGRR